MGGRVVWWGSVQYQKEALWTQVGAIVWLELVATSTASDNSKAAPEDDELNGD